MKKILSVVLAVLMLVTMTSAVFAGMTMNSNHGTTGSFSSLVYVPGDDDGLVDITFVDGENHTLTAKDGENTLENGNVIVTIAVDSSISADLLPGNAGDDAYYEIGGYYILDEAGKEVKINPTTYAFADDTVVYTTVVDTWVPYKDMKQDRTDWYYKYVRDLSIAGVVNGYPDGTFNPQGNVKWGEALKLIILSAGNEAQAATDTHWASGYLAFAYANGLIDEDYEVDLEAPITRIQYATVACKALGFEESAEKGPFEDTEDGFVVALYEHKIVEGSFSGEQRLFKPDNNITRAEMSTVIWRIMKLAK